MPESAIDERPVIIAENNFLTSQLLAETLKLIGRESVIRRDGDGVLAVLEQRGASLLILNMNLGRPGGMELLRTLKQRHPALRILASTSPGQSELKSAAGALGVRSFFEHPFSPPEIAETVKKIIEGRA